MSESPYGQNPPPPPQNPYGSGTGENPYGQPPSGQQPVGDQPPQQPARQNPYGQAPYGQAPYAQNPYGQPPYGQAPYGQQPYGQAPTLGGPLDDGLDMYGRPLGNDTRPGTVTAAGWITMVVAGLSFLLYGFITLAMLVAKDDVLNEIDKALVDQGNTGDFDAEAAFGIVIGVLLAFTLWCLISAVLGFLVLRRSNVSRILLVISAVVSGLLSLLAIKSVVSALPALASFGVVVLLFTGGAGDWFAGRRRY